MLNITPVGAFLDNYIWVLHSQGHAVAVDPGDAQPLLAFLADKQLTLAAVLITHHHNDHTGGLTALTACWPKLAVYGPASLPLVTQPVMEGSVLSVLGHIAQVMALPGHTLDHLAYQIAGHVFCGDTLFGAGCGRVFEGTMRDMYQSLMRLAALPSNTLIYSAHEYTLGNLAFAQVVDPINPALAKRIIQDRERRAHGEPTVPSTLQQELATNPFLRTSEPALVSAACTHANRLLNPGVEVFAELRDWKNHF